LRRVVVVSHDVDVTWSITGVVGSGDNLWNRFGATGEAPAFGIAKLDKEGFYDRAQLIGDAIAASVCGHINLYEEEQAQ